MDCCVGSLTIPCFIIVAYVSFMIWYGTTVVKEYNLSKDHIGATCKVTGIEDKGLVKCDYCVFTGEAWDDFEDCVSFCPCIAVQASYKNITTGKDVSGVVYSSARMANSELNQCSYVVCYELIEENTKYIEKFKANYTKALNDRTEFPCYHPPSDPHKLITEIRHTWTEVLHTMLWPSLLFWGCVLGVCCRLCCLCFKYK